MAESGAVSPVTDQEFEDQVLKSTRPTLVDFWATWCAPCRAVAPVVEELAGQYGQQVNFRKLDIDNNPKVPMKYGIKGIPTLMLFKDGKVLDQLVGAAPKGQLEALIKKAT